MDLADLSIAEIAADYRVPVEKVFSLCNQLGIASKHQKTRLDLEDAKAIIYQTLSEIHPARLATNWVKPKSISGFR